MYLFLSIVRARNQSHVSRPSFCGASTGQRRMNVACDKCCTWSKELQLRPANVDRNSCSSFVLGFSVLGPRKTVPMHGPRSNGWCGRTNRHQIHSTMTRSLRMDEAKLKENVEALEREYASGNNEACQKKIEGCKVLLVGASVVPPFERNQLPSEQSLNLARSAFEIAVMVSLRLQDEGLFERNFSLLQPFYTELRNVIGTSDREHLILGLNLLRLLVQNRISDFHVELEKLSPEAHASGVVQKVVDIEQALLEGAYKQILEAREHVPDETFGYFMDLLIETIRDEIASSCEAAYDTLSFAGAQKLLMLQSEADMKSFLQKRNWNVTGNTFVFQHKDEGDAAIPSMETIQRMLGYARELERIV